jgi:Recombination endonuclease VII
MRKCGKCKQTKSLLEFCNDKSSRLGKSYRCRSCTSLYRDKKVQKKGKLLRKFKITLEQYDSLLVKQMGCCAICSRQRLEFNKDFAVDHCHETGKVRGLLCLNCNVAIGNFQESLALIIKAATYIKGAQSVG